jgi:thiamine-phosphate pyrophosphorylase
VLKRRIEVSGLPVIGIGGISAENASSVIGAGAAGVAVMSAILMASDPRAAARALREAVDAAL